MLVAAMAAAGAVRAGEVARGELAIVGLGLEVQREPVVTAVDVPSYVQTIYAGAADGMSARGDLTGPGIDTPITLSAIPGQKFAIPALHEKGEYLLQNIRLTGPSGGFLQAAIPNVATIQVADVLQTNVKVRQLTPDELRERGILIDDRNFEVYEYTFIFGVGAQTVEIPYPVIIDRRTRQIVPANPAAFRMLPLPQRQKPPRFTPPYIEPFDLSPGGPPVVGDQKDKTPRPAGASLPAALVVPNGFGVLHQFFAVILQVTNSAPEGSNIRVDSITGTIHSPLTMRVAKQIPAVAVGQPVPVVDERTGATFLIAGAQGNAEWVLEAMKAGTHTVDIDVRATYQKPGQDDFPIGGRVSASIVVSDPRFHVNFSHPDVVRKDDKYTAYAFVTNLSNQRQHVELDLSEIPACTSGSHAYNVCRYEGSDTVTLDLDAGEMQPVPYKLISRVTGKVYAAAGAASDEAVAVSVHLTMGVSESGIPLSPATLVMPYYAQFLPTEFVDANMQLFGLGYSLATAPLTKYTALKPRVITTDVFRRAQQVALAGQRIFSIRRNKDTNVPEENRDAFFHLSLDLLGNVERVDQHEVMPELAEWDELRRTEEAGRIAARAMARQLEVAGAAAAPRTFVDDFAAATSHRTPFLFAYVHGPPVAGKARPYALSMRGLTSNTLLDVPAEAASGWMRGLAYAELMKVGEAGELAMAGRWSESLRISVVPSAPSFTLHLLYPDTISGRTLRTDIDITNATAGVPVTIDVARGNRTLILNGATAIPLVNEVGQTPLRVMGAAQDLHLDNGGHVVSLLFNRPFLENLTLRDLIALTINVPKANYTVTRRNGTTAELQVPAARLQEDGRLLLITFDKTLSRNASYEIGLDSIATGIVPRVDNDRPAGILTGKVLNGDNTPVPNLLVKLLSRNDPNAGYANLVQYDVGGADGRYLFEFVPRDIDSGLLGDYSLLTEAPDGRQASLAGSVRLPGEVHFANLVFLGRGKARGQVRWDDGTPIPNVQVGAGSSLFGGMFGATADANGNYEIDGLPVGPLVFSTVDPDGRMVYATNAIRTAGEVITQDLVAVRKEGPAPGVATVRVTVLRSDTMQPVAGALVGVGSEHVQLMTANTDAFGRAEFRGVPAGLMSIIAADYSISRHGAAAEVELRGDQVLEQQLVLQVPNATTRYAWLEGVVTRDDPTAPGDATKDQVVANAVITINNLPPISGNADGTYLYPDIPTDFAGRWIQVFDPATSRSGWFRVPTLVEGSNRFPMRLSSANPDGHGTFRVRVYGGRGEPVAGARVFAPGYPPTNYSNQGGGAYELNDVRVPQHDAFMVVMNDATYGEQYATGDVRVDFDGQIGVSDVRLPGVGTVVVKLEMEQPCSTPPCYAQAIGPVAMTYSVWDDYMQKVMPKTVTAEPDPSTNLVTFTRVPARQDVTFETVRHPGGYAKQGVRLVYDGDLRNISLRLKTIGDVSGRVYAHDGITPVAGATVRITTGTANYAPATTRQDGSFTFAAIPANTSFDVVAELQQDGLFRTAIVSGRTPEGGGPVGNLIAVMREQSTIEGQVLDATDDSAVPLARYWLRELAWPYRSIGTPQEPLQADINGRFVVSNVFTGAFRITAVAPDNQEMRGDYQGTLAEEGDASQRTIKLRIGGAGTGAISITVVDPLIGFEAVANAEVALLRNGGGFDFTTTNDSGVAYFDQVPVGPSYSVVVYSKQRGRSGRSDAFGVVANQTTSRSVQLEFLGIVSGSVTDPDTQPSGLPVRGQPVTYMGPISLRATTDTNGNFEFNGVPEGHFALQAWELATQRIANGPQGLFISKLVPEQRNIRMEMERMGTLTVKVYLPNDTGGPGELAPLVEVTASQCTICNLYTPDYPYYRSSQGNPVVFPRMFTRVGYGLRVRELGGEARTISVGGGFPSGVYAHEQIIVLPQSGTVEAIVLDGNNHPVADARVTFNGDKGTVFTGPDGRASLTGLPFGWYSLQATKGTVSAAASGELKSRSQPLRLTLNLGTNVTVTGFVEAEEGVGLPSPRTRVILEVSSRLGGMRLETLTGDDGHFTFTGIPIGGTSLSLLYFGPDDTTVGARPPPRAIPDGTTGTVVLQSVKLDATPPRVLAIEPPANSTNVSPSAPVTVTFSEPIKPEYLNRSVFELVDTDSPPDMVQSTVTGSLRPDGKTYVVTVTPPPPPATRTHRLKSNMLYRFSIPSGIQDLTGNGLRTAIGSSFTTVNYTEPSIVKIDPPETAPVGEQVTFRIKFNKAVTLEGASITLERLDAYRGNPVAPPMAIARNVDVVDPTTILVAPTGEAIAESSFYRLTAAGVRDTQQPPNVQKETRVFEFFSFDKTKPVIAIASPVGGGEKLVAGVLYSPTVTSTATDIAYVDWLDAGGTSIFRANTKPFAYSFVAPNAPSYTLKATATDLSGNTSDLVAMTWEVTPNLAPGNVTVTNDVASVYPGGRVESRVKFKDEGVSVTVALELRGTALDGAELRQILGSQKITRASTGVEFADAVFTWNAPLSLKDGGATVVATATDSVNNATNAQAAITILHDQTKPVIVSFLPKAESRYKFGVNGSYTIEVQARDLETGVARGVITVGGVQLFDGPPAADGTFRKVVSVPPKNADTRMPIVVTIYDHRGNAFSDTHEVIYERVDDATLPRAAWLTPLDGAVLPSNQTGWLATLRVRASDDVKVTRVRFESTALPAPVDLTAPTSGADIYEAKVALTFGEAPSVIKAIVSDGDPAHDVELPITVEHVAASPVITGEINITASNAAQYADKSVLVRGNVRVYISTPLVLKDLMLVDGATLSVPEETKLDVTAERFFVDGDSRVDVSGKGWLGGLRTREDNSFTNPTTSGRTAAGAGATATADGSHAGIGGSAAGATNATYGSITTPADFGAGGGAGDAGQHGGNGGGFVALRGGRLVLAGNVRADGQAPASGGAGGSVVLDVQSIVTSAVTRISANGGDAGSSLDSDRGGGGGRIAIRAPERFDLDGTAPVLQARGGRNGNNEGAGYIDGGAGTVLVNGALTVSSFDERHPSTTHRTAGTPLAGAFDAIVIGPRALARFDVEVPANLIADPTATIAGPADVPAITLLSTTPAAGADVPQHTSISASYTASSATGVRVVTAGDGRVYPRFASSVANTPLQIPIAANATPGPASFTLRVVDRAGRVAETSSVAFNVVANTAPVIETFEAAAEIYAGRTLAVTAAARDDVAVKSLNLTTTTGSVNAQTPQTPTPQTMPRAFSVTTPPATPSGTTITLTLTAADDFPNRAATTQSRTFAIRKDALPPSVGIVQPVSNQQFNEASNATFLIDVSASDAEVAVQRVTATLDGTVHELAPAGDRWQKSIAVPSVDGVEPVAKTLAVRAHDYEGNTADAAVTFLVKPLIDPDAPVLSWSCGSPGAMYPAGYEVALRVKAVPVNPSNGVNAVEITVGNGTPIPAARIGTTDTFEAKYTIPAATPDGTQLDVRIVARSAAGNESTLLGSITAVAGTIISVASTIAANDLAFEDQSMIVVSGGALTIVGPQRLRHLVVLNGGQVVQQAVDPLRSDELRVERVYVACGGAIDVSALGLAQRTSYPGAGVGDGGSGGSHIGRGTAWWRSTGGVFGSVREPREPGGGGNTGNANEGAGGGAIRIRATGTVIVDGAVRANGQGSGNGGGAGGSVWIHTSASLAGAGSIEARGATAGGGGGGGAIALQYASSFGAWTTDASGGNSRGDNSRSGAAGTVLKNSELLVDGKGVVLSNTSPTELPAFGRASVVSANGTGVTLLERRWVSPSLVGHRLRAYASDGSVRGVYRLASVTRNPTTITLDGWTVVQTQDGTDYAGYLLYTPAGLGGKKYVAVRRFGATWQYDNDATFVTFVPTAGDALFATFSKTGGRFAALEPLRCGAACGAIDGIATAEVVAGQIDPDTYTPNANDGFANFDAGEIFLRPDAERRAFTISAGAASLTLEKLSGTEVQPGDRLRGVHQFDTIELKSARVVSEDLVEGTLKKDAASSLTAGNVAAPVVDATRLSIVNALHGPMLVGAAGAVTDVDGPLDVATRNANHALPLPATLRMDDFLGTGTVGGFSVVHQQNARNGHGSGGTLGRITEGYVAFSPSQTDAPMQLGLSPNDAAADYNEPGHNTFRLNADGTYEVWANATQIKSGAYAANTAFRIEKSTNALRWFVDNVQIHEATTNVPASVVFEISMRNATRGEVGSIEYASGLPARSYHAKVANDGSFRVPLSGAPGDPIRVRARDRHAYSRESEEIAVAAYPPNAAVASMSFAPSEVTGGRTSIGTVTLAAPAGAEGALIVLTSGNAVVTVPASITIAPFATSGMFNATTSAVASPSDVTITATYGGNGTSAVLRVEKDNIPPSVAITSPAPNSEYTEGQAAKIEVRATAADPDSGVKRLTVGFDGNPYPMTLTTSGVWSALVPAPFVDGTANVTKDIVVTAEDNTGNTASSTPVSVIIRPIVDNAPPTISAGCSSGGVLFPVGYAAPLRFVATGPNADNRVQRVEVTVTDPGGAATTITATSKGDDVYEALFTVPDVADNALFNVTATATTASGTTAGAAASFRAIKGAVEIKTATTLNATHDNKSVVIWEGVTATLDGARTFDRLVVLGTITHSVLQKSEITASGIFVSCTGAIDATALGYTYDNRYPGVPSADWADGGSHIGRGGDVNEGRTFGSVYTPMEAGGGGYPGDTRGGGVIRINTGSLTVNGEIRAAGQYHVDAAAGAGGSVWVTATTINGVGTISANGGNACESGAGGAVAIEYTDAASTLPALTARAGTSLPQCGRTGGPGTVRVQGPASTHGSFTIDSAGIGVSTTELPALGSGTAQTGSAGATLVTGRNADIQAFFKGHWVRITAADGTVRGTWRIKSIDAPRTVTLDGASGIAVGDRWQGIYRFDTLTVAGGVNLQSVDPIETNTQTIAGPVTSSLIRTNDLRLTAGAVVTHPIRGSLQIEVANELRIDAGAVIDATALGYRHDDRYPGVPGSEWADGGSHIGRGGDVNEGRTFGSVYTPMEAGGGGYPGDTRGGGVIRITAGSLVVNGEIRAPGQTHVDAAAGAGGSVWITATKISGTGSISANGGNACESGAGGAVAIEYSDPTSTLPALSARAGTALPQCGRIGGPGTVRVHGPTSTYGSFTIDSAGIGMSTTELPALGSGTAQNGSGGATIVTGRNADIQAFFKGHWVRVTATDGTIRGTWRIKTIDAPRTVTLDGASGIVAGDRWQGIYRFDALTIAGAVTLQSNDPIEATSQTIGAPVKTSLIRSGDLRLTAGAVVTHPVRGALQIEVANELRVDAGAVIDATALGYRHDDRYPGVPGSEWADGGSHIGRGGDVNEGRTFGSVYTPMEAGGGGYPGDTRGGGVIRIKSGSLIVNGQIRASGENHVDAAAGAGGSVWITTAKISGTGSITANGGNACESGAGGAVSIEYTDPASTLPALSARAGTALPQCGRIGGPGTVRVHGPTSTHGSISIDSAGVGVSTTELPPLGTGTAQNGSGGATLVSGRGSDIQPFFIGHWVRITAGNGTVRGTWRIKSIDAPRTVTLDGASGIAVGDRWQGVYRFDALTIAGGVTLQSHDPIETTTQTISAPVTTSLIRTTDLRLTAGALVTHPMRGSLQIEVANELRVDAGAIIDATALGYRHDDRYPGVPGLEWADGGSHIGRGGDVAEGRTFGSVYAPREAGGGGHPGETRGGGVIRINAGSVIVNGEIRAPGQNHVDAAAGAGGSVWITATKITGTGSISANGGSACESGAGGVLAIEYTDPSSVLPVLSARAGTSLPQCGRFGGPGSVRVSGPASVHGDITFDSGAAGYGITELPALGSGTAQPGSGGATIVTGRGSDIQAFFLGHWVRVTASNGTLRGTWRIKSIDAPRTITLDGASGIVQSDRWEGLYRFDALTLRGVQLQSVDRIESLRQDVIDFARVDRIRTGWLRVHPSSTLAPWTLGAVDVNATTEVRIDSGGAIDATALGYTHEVRYPGVPGADHADGGSHLGRGGDVSPGKTFGSVHRPTEAGGGGYPGSARGGAVVRIVAPLVVVDGAIRANGQDITGSDNGAGAGGSVWITAAKISGTGSIRADGGTGCEAGGGGALSIEYSDATSVLPTMSARAGGTDCARPGGAGTIFTFAPTSVFGSLLADNTGRGAGTTELPSLGKGVALAGTSGNTLVTDRGADIPAYFVGHWVEIASKGKWRIATISGRTVTLDGATGLAQGDAWEGIYRFDALAKTETTVVSNDRIDVSGATGFSPPETTASATPSTSGGLKPSAPPVDAPVATLTFLTLDPDRVRGGASVQAVVTLSAEAPLGGALVILSSSDPGRVSMPETVFIPYGATTAVFDVHTTPVDEPAGITITATWGLSRSATLRLER